MFPTKELRNVNLKKEDFHSEWNYAIGTNSSVIKKKSFIVS
jgi:hypothetical protein